MAAVKFYFRCLLIVLLILCTNARSYNPFGFHTSYNSYPASHEILGQTSKESYPTSPGLSGQQTSNHPYSSSGGLSGSGRPPSTYPTSTGLSGTGSGSRNPGPSYPPSSGLSGNSLSGSGRPSSSYPTSTGLSGTGSGSRNPGTSYPPSNGLSGNSLSGSGQPSSSYPTSTGLSGTGSGSRNPGPSYPSSNGLSGNVPSTGSGHSYPKITFPVARPNQNVHLTSNPGSSYPPSNSLSGNSPSTGSGLPRPTITFPVARPNQNVHLTSNPGSSYPPSNSLSGNSPSTVPIKLNHNTHEEVHHHHTVVHHHHYVYKPPAVIHYTPPYGKKAVSYPVYTDHHVPSYVHEYSSSNNKYKMLLAGLALYNLGMVSANPTLHNYHKHYAVRADEVCKFGVRYEYGSYEEMRIDCMAITYFIWEYESQPKMTQQVLNQNVVTTSDQIQTLMPNGTLGYPGFGTSITLLPNGTLLNTTNTIITTTTSIWNSKYDGSPVSVSSGMECYILRFTSYSSMRKTVPCGLLNTYAVKSLRNYDVAIKSPAPWILIIMTVALRVAF